jgi:hypothetical protein
LTDNEQLDQKEEGRMNQEYVSQQTKRRGQAMLILKSRRGWQLPIFFGACADTGLLSSHDAAE